MSETFKTGGEKSAKNAGAASHLEVLTEISGEFDPNKARSLAERDKQKTETGDRNSEYLAVIPEKQEKELSPQDAANEYLSLLDELSQDFSHPYYSDERKGRYHYAGGITRELGRKYSDNPHYRWSSHESTEAGETDGTMHRIASADAIIAAEIGWRDEGEKVSEKIKQIDKDIADLDANYSKKGRLGKFFGRKKYEKAKERIRSKLSYLDSRRYNKKIAEELAYAYDEEGNAFGSNGYRFDLEERFLWGGEQVLGLTGDVERFERQSKMNEEQSRHFFGLDDPERAKKVERAIELRRKYEAEWSKKK